MPYSAQAIDRKDYLLFLVSGEANGLADIVAYAESVISQAQKNNHTRLLLDETAIVMNVDTHDAIQVANKLVDGQVPRMGFRAAVVCAQENCEKTRAFETAFQNRSINYRMFRDAGAAEEWLKS